MTIRTTNAILSDGFDTENALEIDKLLHNGLRIIHIFFYYPKNVDREAAEKMEKYCHKNKVQCIFHVFDRKARFDLRKVLRGIRKDYYFHVNLYRNRHFVIKLSPYKSLIAEPEGIRILNEKQKEDL